MKDNIILKQQGWSYEAQTALAGATGSDPSYTIEELKAEVSAGTVQLYRVIERTTDSLAPLGFVCLWVDGFGRAPELVVQAGAALQGEPGALAKVIPALVQVMQDSGCASMRVHVEGAARQNLFARQGFKVAETVMRLR